MEFDLQYILNQAVLEEILREDLDDETQDAKERKCSGRRGAPRTRNRCYALHEMDALSDAQFTIMFRLNRKAFSWLLDKIEPIIEPKGSLNNGTYHNVGKEITAKTRLAATLRWLAGGSYLDICFAFGISVAMFYKENGVLWGTIAAIDQVLVIGFPLHDPAKLEEISEGFAKCSGGRMKGCVMAMDGWVCRTRCPNKKESANQMCFRNRKGMWGMVCFAGCDSDCRFVMMSTVCPGSTNDSMAWKVTRLHHEVVRSNALPPEYYFVCDEAVQCCETVLSPFGGRGIGVWRDSFNYHLSSMRQCIERAFGILTRRWGIFWRPLTCDFARWPTVVQVCAKLHNLCLDFGVSSENIGTAAEDVAEGDSAEVFMNYYNAEHGGDYPANADNSSERRKQITAYFKSQGWTRPAHASCNSKLY